MYFKKLEVFGFKSFASKTEFRFEPGVTAIVGPNGVGKSNIADAIRWVLGEQSAREMRGLRMEDVIFNGTVDKEPVSMAEASLTLSNHSKLLPIAYEEVTIARRIFRSGESEYFLNKTPVRLKDISELLMGTGIGTEAYSLLEQGKIDMVLSSKPEERRSVFEEVSGITKYKAKKKEALRKLEQTEANLLRVNDIITEVKRQIGSIERQAAKARRYQNDFDRLKELEVWVAGLEYAQLQEEMTSTQERLKRLKDEELLHLSKLEAASSDLKKAQEELEQLDQRLSKINSESIKVDGYITKNSDKVNLDDERIEELRKRIQELTAEMESSQSKIADLKGQIQGLKTQKDSLNLQKSSKEKFHQEKENSLAQLDHSIELSKQTIQKAKAEVVENMAQNSKVKNDLTQITTNLANNNARLRRLKIEKENTTKELAGIEEKLSSANSEVQEITEKLDRLQTQKVSLQEQLNQLQKEFSGLNRDLEQTRNRAVAVQSRLDLLQELRSKYEGFSEGVKALFQDVVKDKSWHSGICGVVADLIQVVTPEGSNLEATRLEVAVEAALEEQLQSIVAKDRETALQAIGYLKEQNLGRAKFIVLGGISSPQEGKGRGEGVTSAGSHPLILGQAIEFIKVEPSYRALITGLLQDVILVRDLDSALKISKLKAHLKIVTLDGEKLEGGTITGGSQKDEQEVGLIGRDAKINMSRNELDLLTKKLSSLEVEIKEKQETLQRISGQIQPLEGLLQKQQIELANKKTQKENIESDKKKFQDESNLLDLEIDEITSELEQLHSRQDHLKERLKTLEDRLAQLQQTISSNQESIETDSVQREELLVQIAESKTEVSSLLDKEESLDQTLNLLQGTLTGEESLSKSRSNQIEGSRKKISELEAEIATLEAETGKFYRDKELIQANYEGTVERRKLILSNNLEKENQLQQLQRQLERVRGEFHTLEVKNTEISYKQDGLKEKIRGTYKVELENLPPHPDSLPSGERWAEMTFKEELDLDQVRREIEELKAKLDSMGPVNLAAVEEQKQLQERYSFLTNQKEDLLNAKDSLHKAIARINRTTRAMFIEAFEKVQVEFKNFFRMLFGGGETKIFLVDEEDVLESGIEIVARPPGKRLQNISLLSGGEKALTAIALLFAIFKVKPSPFCVMDEIDATLDEANIERFSRVLQDFVKSSQFIIITHNKKTITLADVMYGITMEESGISKVVSVKFAEKKEEAPA